MKDMMRSRSGFTLVEIIVYSAVFSVIIVGFLSIFTAVTQIESRQGAESVVNQESQFLLSTIQRYVENASMVDIPENVATSTLVLRTSASSTDPSSIYLSGTTVYLRQTSSGIATALTSPNVKVTSLSFTRRLNPPGHDSVSTNFTIAYAVSTIPQNVARSLQFAVARVSAATFDSNIIPSSSAMWSIGVPGQTWTSVNGVLNFSGSNVGVGAASPGQALEVNGGVRLNTANSQPTCDGVTGRGTIWVTESGALAADTFQICTKKSDGTYAWLSPSSNPAGSNGQVQFNSSTAFGADPNLFWDNTNKRLGIGTTTPMYPLVLTGSLQLASTSAVIYIGDARFAHSYGVNNAFVGANTGNFTLTGTDNAGFGADALTALTSGSGDTAIGDDAMQQMTSGYNNTGVGEHALEANNGHENVGMGYTTLFLNTTGNDNTAIGFTAGYNDVSGSNNVFLGQAAGYNELGSNYLYIANGAASSSVLIYGNFSTSQLAIATTTLANALNVQGSISASGNISGRAGVILKSPNGTCYNLTVSNNGMLATSSITCI